MPDRRDPSNPNDARAAILSLLSLYALDSDPERVILNRVAWMLRESGWGLLADSDRHLANSMTGELYQVGISDGGLSLFPIADWNQSEFVDPVEPEARPDRVVTVEVEGTQPEPDERPAPPPPLPFLRRVP